MRNKLDLVVLLVCLGLTLGVWQGGIRNDQVAREGLENETIAVEWKMRDYVEHMLDYGGAVHGLYLASNEVDDGELSTFVGAVMKGEEHPEILRISYVEVVKGKGRDDQYIVSQVVDQFGQLYPPSKQNLWEEPRRRAMIEQIIREKSSAIAWVDKVLYISEYEGPGFIVSTPFYREGELKGLINLVLSKEAIEHEIESWVNPGFEWKWWASGQAVVARGGERVVGKKLESQIRTKMPGGEEWGVDLGVSNLPSAYWNLILGLGVLFSLMIYAIVYGVSSTGARAEMMAKEITKELQSEKTRVEVIVNSMSEGLFVVDRETRITFINSRAETLLGVKLSEVKGKVWREVVTVQRGGVTLPYEEWPVAITLQTRKSVGIGLEHDYSYTSCVGKSFPVSIVTSTVEQGGSVEGVVGVFREISREREQYKIATEKTAELERMNKLMVGREQKMVELKKELNLLKNKGDL